MAKQYNKSSCVKRKSRRITRRQKRKMRGGERTPESLQGFLEESFNKDIPASVEMTDLTGKTIIVKNKDGGYLFLGSMTFPDGDLKVFIDNPAIREKIEAWLKGSAPILE